MNYIIKDNKKCSDFDIICRYNDTLVIEESDWLLSLIEAAICFDWDKGLAINERNG